MSKVAKKPVLLAILDGVGLRGEEHGNAFAQANKPNFDRYYSKYPHSMLEASGLPVGLPDGQMGNSEVGHTNIGAGRVVYQSLTRVNKEIKEGTFFTNEVLLSAVANVKENNSKLHIMGLLSDGGVHSHIDHVIAMLKLAKENNVEKVYVHAFTDGRDVGQKSALEYFGQLDKAMAEYGVGELATIAGRYYAMDRDKRWDRVELAYDTVVLGEGLTFQNAEEYINGQYEQEIYDEFIVPARKEGVDGSIQDNDSVVFVNFRPDRAIQLSAVLTNPAYESFEPKRRPQNLVFVSMMKYSDDVNSVIAYEPQDLKNTFGEYVSHLGLKQLRIAETEKYPHVTFFFNGGSNDVFPGEERILINSPKVATYDLQPEMSAYEVTDALLAAINEDKFDTIILNFANPDMVGHSGMLEPTIKAIEAVDECLGKIVDLVLEKGGAAIITADHGNADEVLTDDDKPMTAHTTRNVPFIVTEENVELRDLGALCDIAPTLLDMLGQNQPEEMTGESMIISK